jgi:hypothetical protein
MVRYKFKFGHLVEDPDGDWVKYEDVKDAIDQAWWDAREHEE